MIDGNFWVVAIESTGLAGLGAFVLWALFRLWVKLGIFAKLTKRQTFILMAIFLCLTFAFSALTLFIYRDNSLADELSVNKPSVNKPTTNENSIKSGKGSINVISEGESNVTVH